MVCTFSTALREWVQIIFYFYSAFFIWKTFNLAKVRWHVDESKVEQEQTDKENQHMTARFILNLKTGVSCEVLIANYSAKYTLNRVWDVFIRAVSSLPKDEVLGGPINRLRMTRIAVEKRLGIPDNQRMYKKKPPATST